MASGLKTWRDEGLSEKEKYNLYLCSREWGLKRQAVRERCGGWCERCKAAPMSHVHHLTYARKYREEIGDLAGYCEPCHEFTHGFRDEDPLMGLPPELFGREIRGVYLAGRISGDTGEWRREVMPEWGDLDKYAHDCGEESRQGQSTSLPDRRTVAYCGPFWRPLNEGGHSPGGGPHLLADDAHWNEYEIDYAAIGNPLNVANDIRGWIAASDLVFAWLDSREAYGTLVELGHAAGTGKIVVVAAPHLDRELWLAASFAHRFIRADSAGAAWAKLWRGPDPLDGLTQVVDFY